MPKSSTPTRRKPALLSAAVATATLGLCKPAMADLTVPAYSSRPAAAYTLYLDFGGFSFTGQWDNNSPGATPAFGDATSAFTPTDLSEIEEIWSGTAAAYAPFNVNVTTVDPALAAGKAATDLQRQNYYDTQAQMMHTVVGGTGAWNGNSGELGISFVGTTPDAFGPGEGLHTNWVFSDHAMSSTLGNLFIVTAHENGHGFGLMHQETFGGQSASGSVNAIMAASVDLGAGPTRTLFADGLAVDVGIQNDDGVIANDSGMGGFIDDGIGHSMKTAAPIPSIAGAVYFQSANGVIVPASSSNPQAAGSSSYQPDYWSFTTTGGQVSLTANSGEDYITPGTPDPGATLDALLQIYNSSGTLVASSPTTSLSETISTSLPAGAYFAQVTAVGDAVGGNTTFFDQGPYFLTGSIPGNISPATWSAAGGGTWAAGGNWNPNVPPQGAGTTVTFGNSIQASSTVTLDANWTAGNITFDNATNFYTLAPGAGGSLTLDNGSSRATITVASGSHIISAPIALNSPLTVSVSGQQNSLLISGPISGSVGLRKIGNSTLTLSGSNTYAGATAVFNGLLVIGAPGALPTGGSLSIGTAATTGTLQLAAGVGPVTLSSLAITSGSTLDMQNNKLLVNYGSAANDPVSAIAADLASGYAGGTWAGPGIQSTAAAADPSRFSIGYLDGNRPNDSPAGAVPPNQMILQYTLTGDAFLENSVGFDDLVVVAQNFGKTGEDWAGGNFNYDPNGSVGFADLVSVAQNFGFSSGVSEGLPTGTLSPAWQSATASVPEPASAALAIFATATLLRRRRGSRMRSGAGRHPLVMGATHVCGDRASGPLARYSGRGAREASESSGRGPAPLTNNPLISAQSPAATAARADQPESPATAATAATVSMTPSPAPPSLQMAARSRAATAAQELYLPGHLHCSTMAASPAARAASAAAAPAPMELASASPAVPQT